MKVLVVDDSALSRKVIIRDLERIVDVEVLEASDGEQGVSLAFSEKPDLITMDVEMPGMDGVTAAGKIRRYPDCSHIPIIMISSKTDEMIKKIAFSAGANIFFEKPFESGKLFDYVSELMVKDEIFEGLNVLVVDDSSLMRTVISGTIQVKGAVVYQAEDGVAATEVLATKHIDLLVTDLVMPNMDGIELISYIRNDLNDCELPIILLTAVAEHSVQLEGLRAGADDFLVKPFSREELVSRIHNHYRRIKIAKAFNEQLYSIQKMEEVGLLLSGVMHDTNNALSNIGNLAYLAGTHLNEPEAMSVELENIQNEVHRSAKLIKQLLAFARKSDAKSDHAECFSFESLFNDVVALFLLSKPVNIHLDIQPIDSSLHIKASKARIIQVFLNLLNNAKYALKECPSAEIILQTEVLDAGFEVEIAWEHRVLSCTTLHITLKDNGCGIAKEDLDHIFDALYTTKPEHEGTGLGLTMAKRAVKSYDGMMSVESALSIGTCFHIYFPLVNRSE
ncbi:MAG: response regulator [Mariprofundaceae bacterium]